VLPFHELGDGFRRDTGSLQGSARRDTRLQAGPSSIQASTRPAPLVIVSGVAHHSNPSSLLWTPSKARFLTTHLRSTTDLSALVHLCATSRRQEETRPHEAYPRNYTEHLTTVSPRSRTGSQGSHHLSPRPTRHTSTPHLARTVFSVNETSTRAEHRITRRMPRPPPAKTNPCQSHPPS
jgi:hypothetical protein